MTVLFCMALSMSAPALAANRYSMEKREKESTLPYTFGDLAAARLAVYGILEDKFRTPQPETAESLSRLDAVKLLWTAFATEKAPEKIVENNGKNDVILYRKDKDTKTVYTFLDVPSKYAEQVAWACQNDIAHSLTGTEFGVYNTDENAFVSMLLNAMGYQGKFDYAYAVHFAETIGLSPLGLSRHFTLGDAALYLQKAVEIQTPQGMFVRELMNIPDTKNQAVFPENIILTPLFPDDTDAQIREATRYLAGKITVRGDYLIRNEITEVYDRYHLKKGETWYSSPT